MFVVCKKRKIEPKSIKRKRFYDDLINFTPTIKKHKIYSAFEIKKRKTHKSPEYIDPKKQKQEHKPKCILHEEQYICDIYECSGVQKYYKSSHMPYII